MDYTKALEKDNTKWALSEFTVLHGNFSIIQEYSTGIVCGRFNNRGVWIQVHIEKKIRGTSISDILKNQEEYEVIVVMDEYCLYRKGDIIDYSTIAEESDFSFSDHNNFDLLEYYNENSDIFDV